MPYVHLANGDVEKVTEKELLKNLEESGTPRAYRKGGMEHFVIGVYPDEVEHPLSEADQAAVTAKENAEKAEFDKWKSTNKPAKPERGSL